MMSVRDMTIRARLTSTTVVVTSVALALAGSGFLAYYWFSFRGALVRNLSVQAETIALNSVPALRFDDPQSAGETLSALRADPNIITAAIYSAGGSLFASYSGTSEKPPATRASRVDGTETVTFRGRALELDHSILSEGERLGTVYLAYSLDGLYADAARAGLIGIFAVAFSVLVALLASTRIQRSVSEPIARLADAAKAISREKDYSIRVAPTERRDELGLLLETFNAMLGQIQARDAEVARLNEQLEQRVIQRTAELEATNNELEAFTYSVSHDLRAPLRRIDGFSQLLMDDYAAQLPEEAKHYLSRVREGTRQMGMLVDDLLNLARLGRREPDMRITGLSSIVERVVSDLRRDVEGREIDWKLDPLPFVECDPALMEVVFMNLLSNAVKYTRPRARAVIEVGASERDGHPLLFVRDNGVGFSMKYADKLFGVFQRLHRPEDFEGTGVGLATVQRILHKHAGTIWAEAELDKGACFYFTIGANVQSRAAGNEGVLHAR